jgi:3D (Asp-Asp-Asp) domain-containing protein
MRGENVMKKNTMMLFDKKNYMVVTVVMMVAIVLFAFPVMSIAESDIEQGATTSTEESPPSESPPSESPQVEDDHSSAPDTPIYEAQAKANGKSHVTIKWSLVENAKGYTVYRSEKSDKLGKKIFTSGKASVNHVKDKTADIDGKYWYTVEAWMKAGGKKETIAVMKTDKVKNDLDYKSSFEAKTYAYSGGGTTASGKKAQVGRVAVDPNVIKLGTWLYIEDYGLCEAADTGGSIKGNKIDLYMDSTDKCYDWGVRNKTVYILE